MDDSLQRLQQAAREQTFWKYHVIRINRLELYVTTNPSERHKFMRSAPSYYVQIQLPEGVSGHYKRSGFKLVFSQQLWGEENESKCPEFSIEKLPGHSSGYKVVCNFNECETADGKIENRLISKAPALDFTPIHKSNGPYGEGVALTGGYSLGKRLQVCHLKETAKSSFLFKNKIDGIKLGKDGSTYFMDLAYFPTSVWYDPLVALFRPCRREVANKISKQVMTSSSKIAGFRSSVTLQGKRSNEIAVDNEETKTYEEQYTYYMAGDGLRDRHPEDDSPNDFKLGWVTIYDRPKYFVQGSGGGNWETVLAMSLAVGFEQMVDKWLDVK